MSGQMRMRRMDSWITKGEHFRNRCSWFWKHYTEVNGKGMERQVGTDWEKDSWETEECGLDFVGSDWLNMKRLGTNMNFSNFSVWHLCEETLKHGEVVVTEEQL